MFYRINVSEKDQNLHRHLFATADHSLTSKEAFLRCLKVIKKKFPSTQGYVISCSYRKTEGQLVTDAGDISCP